MMEGGEGGEVGEKCLTCAVSANGAFITDQISRRGASEMLIEHTIQAPRLVLVGR